MPVYPGAFPQRWPIDAAPSGRATATMGHRCCGNRIHGPSLRLPGPAEQHRWPIVAAAGPGRRRVPGMPGAGHRDGGHREPGAVRAGNWVARNDTAASDAVTFTLCAPEPAMLLATTPPARSCWRLDAMLFEPRRKHGPMPPEADPGASGGISGRFLAVSWLSLSGKRPGCGCRSGRRRAGRTGRCPWRCPA